MNRYRLMAGILVFGSIWGLLECVVGGAQVTAGSMGQLPMGAVMAGLFGVGLMAGTRRLFGVPGMQIGMALVAGLLRFWAPIGTYVICSALAIAAEGLVFEFFMLSPSLRLDRLKAPAAQASLGVIIAYTVYVTGYIFTQITTPMAAGEAVVWADVASVIPLGLGRGFIAAVLGGVALPLAVRAGALHIDIERIRREFYYPASAATTAFVWVVFAFLYVL